MASASQGQKNEYKEKGRVAIDTKALLQSQESVAENLATTYDSLADFPEISCDVNMTAQDLKMAHALSCGLLTTFGGTLQHLVETMIPLVLEGIESMDAELLEEAFDQVIENTESMTNETRAVLKRYDEIQTKLESQISVITRQNNLALVSNEECELKKAFEQSIIDQAFEDKKQLEAELSFIEVDMKYLKDEGEKISKQTGGNRMSAAPLQSYVEENTSSRGDSGSFFDYIFKLLEDVFRFMRTSPKSKTVEEQLQRLEEFETRARKARERQREIQDKIDEKQLEVDTRKGNIRKLGDPVKLGNAHGIGEAIKDLKTVKQSFTNMSSFWESMSYEIKHLKQNLSTNEKLERLLEDTDKGNKVRERLNGYDKECQYFAETFLQYRKDSEEIIKTIYNFLPMSFENSSKNQQQAKTKALLSGN